MGNATRWLDVEVGTDDIELNTLPSNLALVDLLNDNEIKLLTGDLGREDESKLKVFRGAMQISDILLPDLPLGVVGFYTSETMPRSIPVIAVAFSSSIYIYRNLKLFYKYYLPTIELSASEMEVWKQLIDSQNQNLETITALTESLRMIPEKILSLQSKHFVSMPSDQQLEYLETITELPTRKVPEVTCIATLKLNSVDRYSVSCLIVGTEDGDVIVLDPQTFTQLSQAKICGTKRTPCQIVTTGLFNVDYRLTIATREKSVFLLKREWKEGRLMFNTDDHIVAIEVMTSDNSVIVICADNTMMCFNKKGKKQWCLSLEHRPVSMTLVPIIHLGVTLTAVGLASGHVHMYDGKVKRDTMFIRDVASIMKFGQLGQEEHVLVIITGGGNLMLKILKRTAEFGESAAGLESTYAGAAAHNSVRPWLIPKKSKLFIEQSIRERENATQMHSAFQVELSRVRLLCARALLEAHHSADHNVAAGVLRPIALTAEVEGLGPVFRVSLLVENTSNEKAVIGLSILFHAHTANYKVSNPHIKIPLLAPGSKLNFPTKIEEVFNEETSPDIFFRSVTGQGGERSLVKILLLKEGRQSPVLAAVVQMPPTDPMMLPYDKMQATSGFLTSGN